MINLSIASSGLVFEFYLFTFAILPTLHNNLFLMNMISFKFWVHFLLDFVNSILFATLLNQMSYNRGKTDGKTQKSKRKCFFQQKCFWSEPKASASFSGVLFVENHKGNKRRDTKNQITYFKFLFCCSRFDRALER